jgi:hypothetical protein
VRDGVGREVIHADGSNAALYVGAADNEGDVIVRDGVGREVIHANGSNAALYVGATGGKRDGNEGDVIVRDGGGREVIHLDGGNAALYVGQRGNEGDIILRDGQGKEVFRVDGQYAAVYIGAEGNEGDLIVRDGGGRQVFHVDSNYAAVYIGADGNEGDLFVRDGDGVDRIHLNGSTGDIRLMGADVAEDFEPVVDIEPGDVVIAVGADQAAPATSAYDRRVIGVASGAGGFQPAVRLGTRKLPGRIPVAVMGRVFCKVDADAAPIEAGDLLTTSPTPGHAMRARPALGAGSILGKALAPLRSGRDLVPVLLTLR